MQTFLPYSSFLLSAQCLDRQRLGKQRIEAKQIIETLRGGKQGWANHPAVKMWKGYEASLALYGIEICEEWRRRGYKDTLLPWFHQFVVPTTTHPWWLGEEKFHSYHRGTLLSKNPAWYSQFGWTEEAKYEYWWPTK